MSSMKTFYFLIFGVLRITRLHLLVQLYLLFCTPLTVLQNQRYIIVALSAKVSRDHPLPAILNSFARDFSSAPAGTLKGIRDTLQCFSWAYAIHCSVLDWMLYFCFCLSFRAILLQKRNQRMRPITL